MLANANAVSGVTGVFVATSASPETPDHARAVGKEDRRRHAGNGELRPDPIEGRLAGGRSNAARDSVGVDGPGGPEAESGGPRAPVNEAGAARELRREPGGSTARDRDAVDASG